MLKSIGIAMCSLTIAACGVYKTELKKVRGSGFLLHEDKTESIGGIDSNNNQIRDDIEQYINAKYKNNKEYAKVYLGFAKALRNEMTANSKDREVYRRLSAESTRHLVCAKILDTNLEYRFNESETMNLIALHNNTKNRQKEEERISKLMSGMAISLPATDHCEIDLMIDGAKDKPEMVAPQK